MKFGFVGAKRAGKPGQPSKLNKRFSREFEGWDEGVGAGFREIMLTDGLSRTAIGRSSEHQVSALQNLTSLLRNAFSSQFVFPVLGHDDPGSSPGERLSYGDLADFWRQWLPTEAIQTFKT
ncbi:uncharacterized protein LOC120356479, partial [Nilaparvata lugens]|uniref:uncharacterized protein LOC120356479 n=1 Tax=Nilaparvata lugens TaxID=108931 RepID=UPI00193CDEBD